MGKRISNWIDLFQSLREAFVEVLQAEVTSLRADFERSKRHFGRALGLAALAIFVGFWSIGVLVFLLIQIASLWLPAWAAALVVLAVLVIVVVALAVSARGALRQVEEPRVLIRRHVQDHMDWWEDQILPAGDDAKETLSPGAETSAAGNREIP